MHLDKPWLIIGSTAAYHWWPDFREPKDLDLLTPTQIAAPGVIDAQWHEVGEFIIAKNKDRVFADPNVLYTLKVSHAHWNVKWDKTMFDVHFMQNKGCELDMELYNKLIPVWERVHGPKRVNMAKTMDVFFKDAVIREYDHEWLHELVAFYDRPLHEVLRPDHGTAWCDVNKFNALTRDDQARCVLEETMATAIERSRLKVGMPDSRLREAMSKAHFQLCTSMTKGWFARFLILNRFDLLFTRKHEWMPVLKKALSALNSSPSPRLASSSPRS
jgi:hypothetical protein